MRIVQNKKQTDTETEDEDDDDDDEKEMPEEAGKHMTHQKERDDTPRYAQTPKMMQYKSTQTEKCLRVRKQKIIIGGQTEIQKD